MKTKRIRSYRSFVKDGRHYYPRLESGTVYLPHFAVNAEKAANHHKRTLVCTSHVIFNRLNFCAVCFEWYSRFGYRCRWFYFRDNQAVTFRNLTWDEKGKVCKAFLNSCAVDHQLDHLIAPTKKVVAFAAGRMGVL